MPKTAPPIYQHLLLSAGAGACSYRSISAADTQPAAVAAVDRWDRDGRTDRRTPDRYVDLALHAVRAASIKIWRQGSFELIKGYEL